MERQLNAASVRRIAKKAKNCVEIKPLKKQPEILSFLLKTEPDPARIQIYLETGTVVTLRVFNGSVRHIFTPGCKLQQLENIFKNPQDMSLKNMKRMLRNNAKKDEPPLEDEELLDIGEVVLAAESNALKKQCLALKKERKRKENSRYSYSYNFPQQSVTTQMDNIIKSSVREKNHIKSIATNGTSVVTLHEKGKSWNATDKIPPALMAKLLQAKSKPTYVSLGKHNRYFILFKDGKTHWDGPKAMDLLFLVRPVRCVAFGREKEDIVVVYDDGSWKHLGNLPPDLEEFLMEGGRKKNIVSITLGSNGEFFVKNKEGSMWWGGLPKKANETIDKLIHDAGKTLYLVDFGSSQGSYFIMYS